MNNTCPNCSLPSWDGAEVLRCPKCCYTKEFMEYAEFAKLVGTCTETIKRWEKSGRIKGTRFGPRLVRIHRSQYDRIAGLGTEDNQK